MFILRSSSAAHAFIDIVRCTLGNPHLVDVIESAVPFDPRDRRELEAHLERTLGAAEVIAAACHERPRKGMAVPIDVRDPAIRAALVAMLELYLQFLALGDTAGCCADALDVWEIRMTIQAALDLPPRRVPGQGWSQGWDRGLVEGPAQGPDQGPNQGPDQGRGVAAVGGASPASSTSSSSRMPTSV